MAADPRTEHTPAELLAMAPASATEVLAHYPPERHPRLERILVWGERHAIILAAGYQALETQLADAQLLASCHLEMAEDYKRKLDAALAELQRLRGGVPPVSTLNGG